jgi:hypothetical protein
MTNGKSVRHRPVFLIWYAYNLSYFIITVTSRITTTRRGNTEFVRNALPLVSAVAHKMQWRGYLNIIILSWSKQNISLISNNTNYVNFYTNF